MARKLSVTCILPAHNEAGGILRTLKDFDVLAENSEFEFKLFISEDGSTDNTRNVIMSSKSEFKLKIELSPESGRLGYSAAVIRGLESANSDIIWFSDSDGQFDPSDIFLLISKLADNKIVCGYRKKRVDSLARRLYSSTFKILYQILGGPKLRDPSSPFLIAFKKDIDWICKKKNYMTFGFWWEFQARMMSRGVEVIEVPISHRERYDGETQVYNLRRMPKIIYSQTIGLIKLMNEISKENI